MQRELSGIRSWFYANPNTKLILLYGIGSGLLCLPTNLISRIACTACCPYRGFLGGLPLIFLPFVAAFVVSLFADWRTIPYEKAVRTGFEIGLRTGVVSAGTGFVVTVLTEIAGILYAASATSGASNPWEQAARDVALQSLTQVTFYTIVIAAIFAVLGAGGGILGGSLGAALKRQPSATTGRVS
jgi:hypothetical protein